MLRVWRRALARPVLVLSLTIAATETTTAYALPLQEPLPQTSPAPAPSEIGAQALLARAHTVFIQNNGADDTFPADPGAGYLRFVNAMRRWGRYTIVDDVKQADVVIQFRSATVSSAVASSDDTAPSLVYTPYFHLTIAEPTHLSPLWTMSVAVGLGLHKGTDYFDISVENSVSQIKLLTGAPLTAQEQAAMRVPDQVRRRHGYLALAVIGGMVAAGVGGGILLHHEFENSVAKQEADSHQFCLENHIQGC